MSDVFISHMVVWIGLIFFPIFLLCLIIYGLVRWIDSDKEKIKKMSCEQLRQYVLDGEDDWKYAKVQYDLRCSESGFVNKHEPVNDNNLDGGRANS